MGEMLLRDETKVPRASIFVSDLGDNAVAARSPSTLNSREPERLQGDLSSTSEPQKRTSACAGH